MKAQLLEALRLRLGASALDVGCGTGDDVRDMALLAGPAGAVTGIDRSELMVEEARRRSEHSLLPVQFRHADALELPFSDGSFDACRSERVLMHVEDPQRAVREMARVTKTGGCVAVFDFDWELTLISHHDEETTRLVNQHLGREIRNGAIARQLPALFRKAGLLEVTVTPAGLTPDWELFGFIVGGMIENAEPAETMRHWWRQLEEMAEAGEFLCVFHGLIVSGLRGPGALPN